MLHAGAVAVEDVNGGGDTLTGDGFANFPFGGFGGVANDTLDCGAGVDVGDGGLQVDTATECETVFDIP